MWKRSLPVAASIIMCELMLWAVGYPTWWQEIGRPDNRIFAEADELRGWRMKPGNFVLTDGIRTIGANYGADGRRVSEEQSDGTGPAVVLLGDSYVQGFGLNDQDTFAWLLQSKLPGWRVKNFGTGGYGTSQVYLTLKGLIAQGVADGTWAVYLFNGFHQERSVGGVDWLRVMKEPPPGFNFPYYTIDGLGELRLVRSSGQMVWGLSRYVRLIALAEDLFRRAQAGQRFSKRAEVTRKLLQVANQAASSAGWKLVVVLFDLSDVERALYGKFLDSHKFNWLDCSFPGYLDAAYRQDDGHPNGEAHKKIAECIGNWLTSRIAG